MRVFSLVCLLACVALASASVAPTRYHTVPEVRQAFTSLGRAPGSTPLQLHFFLKQRNLDQLEQLFWEVSDPTHPSYGKHLSLKQVNALIAPHPADVELVKGFLLSYGVTDVSLNLAGDCLSAQTTVATANLLLAADYQRFYHKAHGEVVRTTSYSLPAEVARVVDIVGPTTRFFNSRIQPRAVESLASTNGLFVTPESLRKLYNVGGYKSSSKNNSVALTGFLDQYISTSDLNKFFQQLDKQSVGRKPIIVGPNQESNPGIEANLDIQYGMALGAGVKSYFWSTNGQQPGNPENEPFLKFLYDVSNTTEAPLVFSISYGDNEDSVLVDYAARVNVEFQKAGVRGITVMASSGDGGVAGSQPSFCSKFIPTFPAGSPYITAVGGTTSSGPEVAASLSAGGFSNRYAPPSYQTSYIQKYFSVAQNLPDSSHYNSSGAGFPDVAAQAENFLIIVGGFDSPVAGTSCSSPTFAGITALLNDVRLKAGKSSLGFINPLVYQHPEGFNDITQGNNPGCSTNGFYAAAGWDPVTGLGSPNFQALQKIVSELP